MFLGRIKGHVVSSVKDPSVKGHRLVIIEPLKVEYDEPEKAGGSNEGQARFDVTGRAIVAIDSIGGGAGQLVLISQGSSARLAEGLGKVPVDAVVLGIVDEAVVHGQKIV